MAVYTAKMEQGYSSGGRVKTTSITATGTDSVRWERSVADAAADEELDIPEITQANITSLYLLSTQDVTLKTNSSGAPTDTIELKANRAYWWDVNAYNDCLLTGDITANVFATNASGGTAIITFEATLTEA